MLYAPKNVTPNPLFCDVSSLSSSQKCGGCAAPAVEGWCVECGEALCVECVSAHRRVRMTRDHTIQTQITSSGFARKRYCSIHKDEPYKLFCLTCSKLTCRDCQLTLHRNHSFQFVAEVVSERRQRLEALVHKVKEQRAYTQRCLQDLEGRQLDLEDVLEGFKEDVKQALTEIRDLLVQSAMKIMSDAKVLYTSEIDRLKVRQAALQKLQERQAYLLAFSEKTLDSVDQGVLLSCANQVQQQLQALLTQTPPPCASMVHISLHLNKMAVRESLRHFGKVSWHVIPFACSKKLRIPKKVKETHPPPAQALPLDTPNAPCLSGPVEGSAVPPLSTRGSSVSSPLKAMAESTTSSPDCSEGTPALHSAMSMECEPSSTVPDSVGKPTPCWLESPLQVDLPVVTTTASVELSWGKPAGVAEVSTAAPSRSSPTQPPSTSESTFSLGKDPASEVTSVVVMQECTINGNAEASPVEASASCATSETDCFTKTASEAVETGHLQGAETGSPKKLVLRLHPPHIQTDTEHVQGVESASPKIVNVQGAESECVTSEHVQGAELGTLRIVNVQGAEPGTPRIVNVQGAEPGTPRIVDVQGAEPELAQEAEFEGKKTEHVQEVASDFVITEHMQEAESDCRETERVQEAESDCRETERVQEAESECRETECVQEAESECRETECVQEAESDCRETERLQEAESDCRETERLQEAESDCRETERLQEAESDCRETERLQEAESNCRETEHVQEVVSDFVATEHVQTAPPDVSVCPDVGQSSVAPSRLRPPPHSPQTHSQEGPMLQSFLKALKLTVVRNPQLLSNPMCSASQGPDAAGRGADPVSSYCCPLEDDDFDDEEECVDVEMQDEEIYQLLPKKHWLPQVSVYQMPLPSASIGQPPHSSASSRVKVPWSS
ncbi:uncharacterized protein LOC105906330 isoform X2 [Clupea harengus]|nr:uncharacterized protein LOC105906330 isoform X2 [Clupea harengus]